MAIIRGSFLLMLAAGLGLAGCRTGASRPAPLPSPAAVAEYQRGLELRWDGSEASAQAAFEQALVLDPLYVDAHRQRQNTELARHRRGALLREYRTLWEQDPEDPRRIYLLGRLSSDLDRQEEAFQRAHALDPAFAWPSVGLGQVALMRGQVDRAVQFFRLGLDAEPEHRELLLGLAQAYLSQGRVGLAREVLQSESLQERDWTRLELLAECTYRDSGPMLGLREMGLALAEHPSCEPIAQRLRVYFLAEGRAQDAALLTQLLRGEAEVGGETRRLLLVTAMSSGDRDLALRMAAGLAAADPREHRWRRQLLVSAGRVREALERERPRMVALAELGAPNPAFETACDLAESLEATPTSAPLREDLARALRDLGFLQESLTVLEADPSREETPLHEDLCRQIGLEAELRARTDDLYWQADHERSVPDLDAFLDIVGGACQRHLDRNLTADSRPEEFWPLGELLNPDPRAGEELARYFAARGRLVVVGRRLGGPTELLLAPVLGRTRAGPQDADLAWIDGLVVPSYMHHQGADLAGAALHYFAYVDVAAVAAEVESFLDEVRRGSIDGPELLQEAAEPAADADARRSLLEPAEATVKLQCRAQAVATEQGDTLLVQALEEVLVHETAHLEDAQHFLTAAMPILLVLPEFVRRGFSLSSLQGWLEMRAQCAALLRARNPYLALASCTAFLPASRYPESPHGLGYTELVERFVAELDRSLDRFPSIDPGANLLQQLHRLRDQDIRSIAAAIAQDLELPVQRPDLLWHR